MLASRSPRRALLLREAGYAFEQCEPTFNDPPIPEAHHGQTPQDKAIELASRKAMSVDPADCGQFLSEVLLAADTICVAADGSLVGTPTTEDEARTMIASFIDTSHAVITGVALRSELSTVFTFADTAHVVFGHVSDDQLDAYLATNDWRGKAGGYNLFDRQADGWPIEVQGDPTTVVGLPMARLVHELARLGIHPNP